MRRDPDGRFGHIALAARARRRHCFCVCWTCYEEEDPGRRRRRRRRRPWLFMVATWSKSRSYRRNGQIGREGENEREREREWGTRWVGGREGGHAREKRSVAWKVAASELEARRTFAAEETRHKTERGKLSV